MVLGVGDAKMGAAVLEELGVQCQTGGVVAELMRGEWGQGTPRRGPGLVGIPLGWVRSVGDPVPLLEVSLGLHVVAAWCPCVCGHRCPHVVTPCPR